MTSDLLLRDLAIFCLQSTAIVAAAALAAFAGGLRAPRAALAYWRSVLVAVMLLPFCQAWVAEPQPVATAILSSAAVDVTAQEPAAVPRRTPRPSSSQVLVLLAAAVALRTLWLVAGAATLRRIRRSARALDPLPDPIEHVQRRLETTAAFLVTGDSSGPMTYGVVRPVVFLPERVLSLDDPLVEAIASHELMHVRRRDWLEELLLESMLTLLWFHPAVWWLAGRIRLSREHVVDEVCGFSKL